MRGGPTEILAKQHYISKKIFKNQNLNRILS